MLLALDANIWIGTRLLRSALGATLLYVLKTKKGKIILPRATRTEILNGVVDQGIEVRSRIDSGFTTIQALTGQRPSVFLPGETEFRAAAESRLMDLSDVIEETSHSEEQLQAALDRVLAHRPPAHKQEEFRDALFWEVLLQFARNGRELHLVTHDAAFYANAKFDQGIIAALRDEITAAQATVYLYPDIEKVLAALGDSSPLDKNFVIQALEATVRQNLTPIVEKNRATLGRLIDSSVESFITEYHKQLAVSYKLEFEVSDLSLDDGRIVPRAKVKLDGSASYDIDLNEVSNTQFSAIEFVGLDGILIRRDVYISLAGLEIYPKDVPYTLRRRVPQTGTPGNLKD